MKLSSLPPAAWCPALLLFSACTPAVAPSSSQAEVRPTYSQDVKPLLSANCLGCHTAGGIGGLALDTFEAAQTWGPAMAFAVRQRLMPPWNPDNSGGCQTYSNARWLSEEQISTVERWVSAGMPRGPVVAETGSATGIEPAIDVAEVREMTEAYVPMPSDAHPNDDYRCFMVPGFDEDTHVTAFQVRPGQLAQVHHIIGYVAASAEGEELLRQRDDAAEGPGFPCFSGLNDDSVLGVLGWAPGVMTARYPDGVGIEVPGGRSLVFEIHYSLTNGVLPDRTAVAFELRAAVERPALLAGYDDGQLSLAPGQRAATHVHSFSFGEFGVPENLLVYGVSPHMHLRGVSQRLDALSAAGTTTCLMDVPRWDFHWQDTGLYTEPVLLRPTDQLRTTCVFDTMGDSQTVRWGEGTSDEMCLSTLIVTRENGGSFLRWE